MSYSFAAFFASFAAEFAAQRADVALVFGLCGLIYFVLGVGGGMLADRFGPRAVCMSGMVCIAAGLLGTSLAQSMATVYLCYGVGIGIGIALVYTPSIACVQPWFTRRRGLAAGIASAGIGAGTLVLPLLASGAIAWLQWRDALRLLALAVLVLGLGMCGPNAPCPGGQGQQRRRQPAATRPHPARGAAQPHFLVAVFGDGAGGALDVCALCPCVCGGARRRHQHSTGGGAGGLDRHRQPGGPLLSLAPWPTGWAAPSRWC